MPALSRDTRQLTVGGASVEAIDLQPAQQVHELFIVIVNSVVVMVIANVVFLASAGCDGLEQLQQPLGDAKGRVALAQFQERPRPAAVLGWDSAPAANTDWVASPRVERQDVLDPHVVLPAVGEVVFIEEAFTDAQAKVGQAHPSRIVAEADPAVTADPVLTAVEDKAVQVLIAPAQYSLKGGVEIGDGAVAPDEQAAPDQRADAAQNDAKLVHHGLEVRGRLRHLAIMAPVAI